MALTEDKVTKLMDLLKIPVEKQNFEELHNQIQTMMEENTKLMAFYLSKTNNTLEKILNNPGLQHLAEKIFENLNYDYLVICQGINQSSKQILEYQMSKPLFFLRKISQKKKLFKDSSLGIHDYILRAAMNHQAANAYAFSLVSFLETIILYIHL